MVFPEVITCSDRLNLAKIHLQNAKRFFKEGNSQAASFEFGICAASFELAREELQHRIQQNSKKSKRNP